MRSKQTYFVTGTDTGIGKTVVSAVLTTALNAAYWKPVQCGDLNNSDADHVAEWTDNCIIHPEAFRLVLPASPHAAAEAEGIRMSKADLIVPAVDQNLIIEGAGGVMVPLNNEDLIIDWVAELGIPVILVSGNRLGSINHTLLSVEALMNRRIDIAGLVFNGTEAPGSESFITSYTEIPVIGRLKQMDKWDVRLTRQYAAEFQSFFDNSAT